MPKTSESPLATRNRTSPYCTPLRSWTAKVARSIGSPVKASPPFGGDARILARHPAAEGRIGEIGVRDRNVAVQPVLHLAQIDVLHDVVRLGEADRPAR